MRLLASSLGLLLAAASVQTLAQPAPAAPQPAGASPKVSQDTAAALARTVAPVEPMLRAEIEQARKAILALPTLDNDAKELERDYPGLYAALWTAVEPDMKRSAEASYPGYWAALEQLYLARLTEGEAQAVMTYFKSPGGQKLIRTMYGGFDSAPMVAEMTKSNDYTVNEQQLKEATDAAKAKAVQQITDDDKADLWILMASIDLQKFKAIGAETQRVTLDWVNRPDPEGEARMQKLMEQAMQRYMAEHPPKE
jgi:hypothetical protein